MGKLKKGLSDKVRSKLKTKGKPAAVNPFEIKLNKVKHTVVNKKVEKWEKGLPGVSRSKAIKRRKDTILNELRQMKKSNSLYDKRIGEKDNNLTPEEKMIQRFTLERKAKTEKNSQFNLNEDEVVLTHYGQSLAENLKDRPDSDSEDEGAYKHRDDTGRYQFGGFVADGEDTWKDKMKEVIADSKQQKHERQVEKEKSFEATKELDGLWKSIIGKMKPQSKETPTRQMSSFMVLSRSLVMEQRSEGAADKIKSEEQKAREEAEKLKKLEAERLERMNSKEKGNSSDHVSADSLSSGFALSKKGKMKVSFASSDDSDDESENGDADEEDDNEGEESGEDNSEESGSSDEDDKFSDLDEDDDDDDGDDDDDEEEEEEESEADGDNDSAKSDNDKHKKGKASKGSTASILKKSQKTSNETGEESAASLPFVFEAPETFEELFDLLHGHSTKDQITTVSRLRKCYHLSLAEENKEKLEKIHLFLLQYYGKIVLDRNVDKKLVNDLCTHLWEMTQTFPDSTAKFFQDIVLDKQKEYAEVLQKRGGRGLFPSLDTLVYLRLVEMLFPTSDFRHEVTTPSIHFMAQMLAETSVRNLTDVMCGLYLCALCLQYIQSSKRYVPEVVTFLHGVLYLASPSQKQDKTSPPFPPFRTSSKETCPLDIKEKCNHVSPELSLTHVLNSDFAEKDVNQLRCDMTHVCVELLHECTTIWKELPCLSLIMKPVYEQLKTLPCHLYPSSVKDRVGQLTSQIEDAKKLKFTAMQHESKRPKPLALFEPKVEENWTGQRKKGGPNREANSRERMLHKYKREMKSAIREIKRDNAVVAQHKLEVTLQKDAERKRKVKEIMGSLADQEGDYRAIKRGKPS